MARLDEAGHAYQHILAGAADEISSVQTGLPPVRKSAPASFAPQGRTAFSISLFGRLLGADIVEANSRRVRLRLTVRRDLCRADGTIENAALFALADMAVSLGLGLTQTGASCRVLETKTHVFEPATDGSVFTADTSPLHAGGGPSVWQTRIAAGERQIALVLQTCLADA